MSTYKVLAVKPVFPQFFCVTTLREAILLYFIGEDTELYLELACQLPFFCI